MGSIFEPFGRHITGVIEHTQQLPHGAGSVGDDWHDAGSVSDLSLDQIVY